ncbi:hypothetical protein D3C71_1268190 [compost metagenome]
MQHETILVIRMFDNVGSGLIRLIHDFLPFKTDCISTLDDAGLQGLYKPIRIWFADDYDITVP